MNELNKQLDLKVKKKGTMDKVGVGTIKEETKVAHASTQI